MLLTVELLVKCICIDKKSERDRNTNLYIFD